MMYAFDLDGTLADTKLAVLQAYRLAGVKPPEDFFGKPWQDWLSDPDKHKLKNEFYKTDCACLIKPLPLMRLQQLVKGAILTGASREGAKVVIDRLHIDEPNEFHTGLNVEQKVHVLNSLTTKGHYFDDDLKACRYIKENTKWAIHYIQQL